MSMIILCSILSLTKFLFIFRICNPPNGGLCPSPIPFAHPNSQKIALSQYTESKNTLYLHCNILIIIVKSPHR